MSWHKHFKSVNSVLPASDRTVGSSASISKYSNWLPEVYSGPPDRLQRYSVYDQMQLDHEIASALDTIADFGTEMDEVTKLPLVLKFNDDPTPTEIQILEKTLGQWCRLNELNRRLWGMFRSVLIYGDQFYIRDPETFKLYWIDPAKVEKVIVNESEGKRIESYFVKDIDLNMKNLVATNQLNRQSSAAFGSNSIIFSPPLQGNMNYVSGGYGSAGTASYTDNGAVAVDAEHVVQLSMTDGMSASWPFGMSILEPIYKVYKQKGLIEDAILIYRIHRAPERRVFFIDVGTTPPNKAQQFLERVRYEVQQKRIPSKTGGTTVTDSSYNPMCLVMSTQVPLLDGRSLTISDLAGEYKAGKENWAYSADPLTGRLAPGLVTWAGVTRQDARVLEVYLSNGKMITCTPDHKIPVWGKGFVEAQHLLSGDKLISHMTRTSSGVVGDGQVYDHQKKSWVNKGLMTECYFDGTYDQVKGETDDRDYGVSVSLVKWLDMAQDVGTITIDGKEQWHSYHTFAIDAGVFVKNSILEDYFFAVGADGRGSKVDVLPSGSGLSEIDDLRYFNNKMLRALGVPSSYLPTGPEDGTSSVSDGRVGSAFIQEFRFSKVVKRHQTQIIQSLDREFKLFLKHKGLTIDNSLFELEFTTPQSFSEYRQLELDSAKINTFGALTDIPYVSKRFILKRYLGWTEGELAENERMWKEERSRLSKSSTPGQGGNMGAPAASLSDVGITSSGIDSMDGDSESDDGTGQAPMGMDSTQSASTDEQP